MNKWYMIKLGLRWPEPGDVGGGADMGSDAGAEAGAGIESVAGAEAADVADVADSGGAGDDAAESRGGLDGYSFDEPTDGGDGADGGEAGGQETAGYEVDWPEGFNATDELTSLTNDVARECGVSDKALGAFTAGMLERFEELQTQMLAKDDAALKAVWGRDYAANKKEAAAFMGRLMKETGLTKEDVAGFANPKGFRVIYELSRKVGSRPVQGMGAVASNEAAWAHAAMSDASHPDNKALRDVHDPRHREVTERYFRAQGARF